MKHHKKLIAMFLVLSLSVVLIRQVKTNNNDQVSQETVDNQQDNNQQDNNEQDSRSDDVRGPAKVVTGAGRFAGRTVQGAGEVAASLLTLGNFGRERENTSKTNKLHSGKPTTPHKKMTQHKGKQTTDRKKSAATNQE